MTKTVLTPHFDLLNATMIELYIVIKANTKIQKKKIGRAHV